MRRIFIILVFTIVHYQHVNSEDQKKLRDNEVDNSANSNKNLTYTYLLTYPINQPIEVNLLQQNNTQNPTDHDVWYEVVTENQQTNHKHECQRLCTTDTTPRTCWYHFRVESYLTMSKACYECPYNTTHCLLEDCIPADGVKRSITVVNRQLPGTPIEVCLNDVVVIDVTNLLPEASTSIHWHGHHQRTTPFMDGVPFVTQCPIHPKTTFRYSFRADTPGTHFWHSHSGIQRGDGMFGSFIVRKPRALDPHADLFDLDLSEHTMIVFDWTNNPAIDKFLLHHHSNGDNKPNNILVNGKGKFQEYLDADEQVWTTPIETFTVTKDLRYRFRVINAGFLNCPIQVSIDNHTIQVISVDGTDVLPETVDTLVTYAGERFDFVLNANQSIDNYWIKFRGLMDCGENFTSAYQTAVLRYGGAPDEEPEDDVSYETSGRDGLVMNALNTGSNTSDSISIPELTSALQDVDDDILKPEPDYKFFLSYDFNPLDNPHFNKHGLYGFNQTRQFVYTPQFNHISMKMPPFPLMVELENAKKLKLCNSSTIDESCKTKYCECYHILSVPYNSVVELILIDKGVTYDANHPFHLHGYLFRVLGMERIGHSVTEEEIRRLDETGQLQRNFDNPPLKDTVTVPDGGYTVIRWKANNPGYWIFHCHIEYHVELGMALVFKVGDESQFPAKPKGFPTCNNYLPDIQDLLQPTRYKQVKEVDFNKSYSSSLVPFTTIVILSVIILSKFS